MILPERPPTQNEINAFVIENNYIFGLLLPRPVTREQGYQVAFVVPTVPGAATIKIGGLSQREGISETYYYDNLLDCMAAAAAWHETGFDGEPQGWVRHVPSNRRRTYLVREGKPSTYYEEDIRP